MSPDDNRKEENMGKNREWRARDDDATTRETENDNKGTVTHIYADGTVDRDLDDFATR